MTSGFRISWAPEMFRMSWAHELYSGQRAHSCHWDRGGGSWGGWSTVFRQLMTLARVYASLALQNRGRWSVDVAGLFARRDSCPWAQAGL